MPERSDYTITFDDPDNDDDGTSEVEATLPTYFSRPPRSVEIREALDRLEPISPSERRPRRVAAMPDSIRRAARLARDAPMPTYDDRPAVPTPGLRSENMTYRFLSWQSEGFDQVVRSIYPFFSRHSDRRYSETTMRQLADTANQYNEWITHSMVDRLHSEMPVIAVASMPFGYDEETEVKSGGTTGMLVCFPNRGFKTVVAVHRNGRRARVGTALWQQASYRVPSAAFWVHRTNAEGQHFLLSLGMWPTAMNSSGSIRYTQTEDDD